VLRLKYGLNLSERQIAQSCLIGKGTVGNYLKRASQAGLGWPLPQDMDDRALETLLFPRESSHVTAEAGEVQSEASEEQAESPGAPPPLPNRYPLPDWHYVQGELESHKGVTRRLLWEEYGVGDGLAEDEDD
jgi:hypothetical protein